MAGRCRAVGWRRVRQLVLSGRDAADARGRVLATAAVAILLALQTERGRAIWSLLKEARTEVRRVVWPTNQETTQTTLVVIAIVFVFALILWGLDSLLGWIVSSIIG